MAVAKCDKGHFYDDTKYQSCPHCASGVPANPPVGEIRIETGGPQLRQGARQDNEGVTVALRKQRGVDPVAGWLVCVEGPERGRDYRVFTGRNFVGRAPKSSICIADDPEISREDHCSVIFEPLKCQFLLAPGSGTNTYINGKRLDIATLLQSDDEIRIGGSMFVFVPYCKEGRKWE